jgi:hypothetical protein
VSAVISISVIRLFRLYKKAPEICGFESLLATTMTLTMRILPYIALV